MTRLRELHMTGGQPASGLKHFHSRNLAMIFICTQKRHIGLHGQIFHAPFSAVQRPRPKAESWKGGRQRRRSARNIRSGARVAEASGCQPRSCMQPRMVMEKATRVLRQPCYVREQRCCQPKRPSRKSSKAGLTPATAAARRQGAAASDPATNLIMRPRMGRSLLRRDIANEVLGPGVCTVQQQEPSALQVWRARQGF